MGFRFEKLDIWHDARTYTKDIYSLTSKYPKNETFGLVDQLRRASVSIVLNIAEGSDRKSDKEFKRYLRMALTSIAEVVTALYISLDQKYITQSEFDKLYLSANKLTARINALVNSLKSSSL